MRIGIIGAGMIGGTLGNLWHAAGHEVVLATRHPEALSKLVADMGAGAKAGTPADAARAGDVVLLAVPLFSVPAVAGEIAAHVAGKVVLDACNAYEQRDGELGTAATKDACGSSGWVAAHFAEAKVVKAFNTVFFKVLAREARPGAEDGVGIPLAGDDEEALVTAGQLAKDAGFSPVVVGPLASGKRFEPGTPVYNSGMRASELARTLGVAGAGEP